MSFTVPTLGRTAVRPYNTRIVLRGWRLALIVMMVWTVWSLNLAAGPTPAHLPQLLSVELVPQDVTLWGRKGSQRFLVLGKYSDGLQRDVTTLSRFSLSHSEVAKVDESGRVLALSDGETIFRAEVEAHVAETNVRVEEADEETPFSFARDIGGIFTKRGCNTSDCHGSVKGKGGLKLSMNALYPRDDYKWIVEGGVYQVLSAESGGPKVPRVNLEEPEKSSLLLKPTFAVPHGGGQRFNEDSADYQSILDWVRSGAPYGEEAEASAKIERIEVFPREVALDPQGRHQLLVTAHLSNGRYEDITEQVLYVSNNAEVVKVAPEGLVKAVRTGETAVTIRAAGHAASATFGVIAKPVPDYPEVPRRNFIDDYVFAKLRKFNIVPSELSGDAEFLRRVCLDVTGTLPPPQRVREFLASKDPQKREKLIEILLNSPEYVDYWTFRFADLFRVASWAQAGPQHTRMYWEWIRDGVFRNRPYDQVARERVAGQGFDGPSSHYFGTGGELPLPPNMMAEQVRVFMGRRLDCAQCHNHPYESWSQNQFWGLTAFFGHLTRSGSLGIGAVIFDDPAGHGEYGQGEKVTHPRTKEEVQPAFLNGRVLPENERRDLRWKLAEWMTSHPYFVEAIVNRMWSYFFGRGLVDPVDDFRLTNPPTHPQLLEVLARDFKEHGYDRRRLIRVILQSRTYQLSAQPNATNQDDQINYSHALARALDAEVLLDAVSHVAGVAEDFYFHKDTGARLPPGTRAINILPPDLYPSRFLKAYGQPNRLAVPERKVEPNMKQALAMLAGPEYTSKLSKEGSRVKRLLEGGAASDGKIIEELYLAALSRYPTEEEKSELEKMIAPRPSRMEAVEDLVWGLVASREFVYNH